MAIDWADDVEEAIESGELPDYALKTQISIDGGVSQEPNIVPKVVSAMSTQGNLNWKSAKSWRKGPKTEQPISAPESISFASAITTQDGASQGADAKELSPNPVVPDPVVQAPSNISSECFTASEGTLPSAYETPLESPMPSPAEINDSIELKENIEGLIPAKLQQPSSDCTELEEDIEKMIYNKLEQKSKDSTESKENIEEIIRNKLQESSDDKYYNGDQDVSPPH
jgi:hypothetical protein